MQTSQKAHPVLLLLLKIQRKYKKDYSFPSQKKILELLEINQKLKKSRASLNRWLRKMEDEKYLIRRRRIKRHRLYGIVFKSSLYKITIKGYALLSALGVAVFDEIKKYQDWLKEIRPERKKRSDARRDSPGGKKEVEKIIGGVVDALGP